MTDDGMLGIAMVVAMLIGMVFTVGLCVRVIMWLLSGVLVVWHVLAQG